MVRHKELTTAAGTLCCALAIGFFMQNTESARKRYGDAPINTSIAQADKSTPVRLSFDEVMLTSADVEKSVIKPVARLTQSPSPFAVSADVSDRADIDLLTTLSCETVVGESSQQSETCLSE